MVARDLLGAAICRRDASGWVGGRIVETEAYLHSGDLASHAARGMTPSNQSMFASPGTLYVYPIHAKHCLNVVTEAKGRGSAVLIRAIEPIWGLEVMAARRGRTDPRQLARGPAMICQAFAVDRRQDGDDLIRQNNWRVAPLPGQPDESRIACGPRIGIRRAAELPLRFFEQQNRYVSGPRRGR